MNNVPRDGFFVPPSGGASDNRAAKPEEGVVTELPAPSQEMEADAGGRRFPIDVRRPPQTLDAELLRIQVLWVLIGVAGGILTGMLFGRSPGCDRVDLATSMPLALLGGIAGLLLGAGLSTVYKMVPGARYFLIVLSVVLLSISLGATTGWAIGSEKYVGWLPWEFEQWTRRGMVVGAWSGLFFGLPVGMAHAFLQRTQGVPDKEADPRGTTHA